MGGCPACTGKKPDVDWTRRPEFGQPIGVTCPEFGQPIGGKSLESGQPKIVRSLEDGEPISRTFIIPLDADGDVFGFDVDMDDDLALIITAIRDGQVQDWNMQRPSGEHVRVGDRILSVNSVRGDPRQILDMLTSQGILELEIKPHSEFSVSLCNQANQPLGFSARFREGGNTLFIRKVGEGAIAAWNAAHAGQEIVAGDRIIEVNGIRGFGSDLDQMLKGGGAFDLVLVPFDGVARSMHTLTVDVTEEQGEYQDVATVSYTHQDTASCTAFDGVARSMHTRTVDVTEEQGEYQDVATVSYTHQDVDKASCTQQDAILRNRFDWISCLPKQPSCTECFPRVVTRRKLVSELLLSKKK